MGIAKNRQVSINSGKYTQVQSLEIPDDGLVVHLKKFGHVKVFRRTFKNETERYYIMYLPETEATQQITPSRNLSKIVRPSNQLTSDTYRHSNTRPDNLVGSRSDITTAPLPFGTVLAPFSAHGYSVCTSLSLLDFLSNNPHNSGMSFHQPQLNCDHHGSNAILWGKRVA